MTPNELFPGLAPPYPPEPLRDRVLAAARRAVPASRPPLVDRLWASPRLRLAWAAAVLALVAANLLVPAAGPCVAPLDGGRSASLAAALTGDLDQWLAGLRPPRSSTPTVADRRWADQVLAEATNNPS